MLEKVEIGKLYMVDKEEGRVRVYFNEGDVVRVEKGLSEDRIRLRLEECSFYTFPIPLEDALKCLVEIEGENAILEEKGEDIDGPTDS